MRTLLTLLFLLVTVTAHASAGDGVFGLAAGVYQGSGVLVSGGLIPNLSFTSVRKLENGVIRAHTVAKILGMKVAEAHANLQIIAIDQNNFQMVDVDTNKVCGKGICKGSICAFAASVMNGDLKLKETWVQAKPGFKLINGWQNFKGLESTYSGSFTPLQ